MLFVVGIVPAIMVVLVRRGLQEPDSWKKAHAEQEGEPTSGHAKKAEMGSLGEMLGDPRWRYHTIIGVLLALAGVIGLWGVGFWTFGACQVRTPRAGRLLQRGSPACGGLGHSLAGRGGLCGDAGVQQCGRSDGPAGGVRPRLLAGAGGHVVRLRHSQQGVGHSSGCSPLLGFFQLVVFGGFAIYFPELFPTRCSRAPVSLQRRPHLRRWGRSCRCRWFLYTPGSVRRCWRLPCSRTAACATRRYDRVLRCSFSAC